MAINKITSYFNLKYLASTKLFCLIIFWLFCLVAIGTYVQKDIGLYFAQQKYFYSYFIWFNYLPMPGGQLTLGMLFVSLLSKLLLDNLHIKKIGTFIVHLGVLLMLVGGFITNNFSTEGSITLLKHEHANYFSDNFAIELVIEDINTQEQFIIDEQQLNNLKVTTTLPVTLQLRKYAKIAKLIDYTKHSFSISNFSNESEATNAAVIISMENTSYLITEELVQPMKIYSNGNHYYIYLRHKQIPLPFTIKLENFIKELHPGTNNARAYQSTVTISDLTDQKLIKWRGKIEMNQPLRYQNYTFYQASYLEATNDSDDAQATQGSIFAVVKNIGQSFPYISSSIMCLGLLLHLFQRLPKVLKRSNFHV